MCMNPVFEDIRLTVSGRLRWPSNCATRAHMRPEHTFWRKMATTERSAAGSGGSR